MCHAVSIFYYFVYFIFDKDVMMYVVFALVTVLRLLQTIPVVMVCKLYI